MSQQTFQLTPVTESFGLSEAQIDSFWETGILVVDEVFSEEDVSALRDACATPEVTGGLEGRDSANRAVHLIEITAKHPLFMELAMSPRILQRITPLIGPDIQLQHSKLATKPTAKGKGAFKWHQDFAYFPHTNSDLVAVMVMLDDATLENGCMQIVRGSNKMGLLDHNEADGTFEGQCKESHLWEEESRLDNVTPKTGGISIHHCMTLHGSPANLSGNPRRGVVFQYRADDAFQLADGVFRDTGLLMCGERKERARCDAGVLRLPKSHRYPEHPFGDAWNQEGELSRKRDFFSHSS